MRIFPAGVLGLVIASSAACSSGPAPSTPPSHPASGRLDGGRVYVIDTGTTDGGEQIMLVDTATGSIVHRIPASYTPDIAIAPRGSEIYVTSPGPTDVNLARVSAIDTNTWEKTADVAIPGRFYYIVRPPARDWLQVSQDGRHLFYLAYGEGGCGDCGSYVVSVDLPTGTIEVRWRLEHCAAVGWNLTHLTLRRIYSAQAAARSGWTWRPASSQTFNRLSQCGLRRSTHNPRCCIC